MNVLRAFLSTVSLLVFQSGCTAVPPTMTGNTVSRTVSLKLGESTTIESEPLIIGFESVARDSRCPKGEMCLSQGDATVRIWVQRSAAARHLVELHTAAAKQRFATVEGWYFHLESLAPYPVSGRVIAAGAYIATISVSSAAPDDGGLR